MLLEFSSELKDYVVAVCQIQKWMENPLECCVLKLNTFLLS